MFKNLSERLTGIFDKLKSRGSLTENDVDLALREVRVALLEADVSLEVVKSFLDTAKKKAVGSKIVKSVSPSQMVIKIVNDTLKEILGNKEEPLNLKTTPPAIILMVGLQGSGKTTTSAKIAKKLKDKDKKKVLMSSLDVQRPAAQEQLATLGKQVDVSTVEIIKGEQPVKIAERSLEQAKKEGFDVLILDTAGRLQINNELMNEVRDVSKAVNPTEILLVSDSMIGQESVNVAKEFNEKLKLTGIILTRLDGDARGGAALSMRFVTGCPIKLIGVGEKMEAIEVFHPDRVANRILGMGDVVTLVEEASQTIKKEDADKLDKKIKDGQFSLDDLSKQLGQMKKLGGIKGILSKLPGASKIQDQMNKANIDDKVILRQQAIISSMTLDERNNHKIIHASRKKRIASGSGTSIQEVNKLLKQYHTMLKMMKKYGNMDKKTLMRQGFGNILPPGLQ
ncbi:MAG: Signal recognition particle protein [Alphaproteobacteria bacterium MarineAlpha6_Bin6]|nr:signal recognition particle protein [Pelagibacteraceae bacterium]PPR30257.1 MAG: Signal recognition particle protein [Alphaproteobacteria bacterium MarineAlpha6_Bin6]PPR33920.1 MAG: Signal recognition particle protein [Alphaproteobacteria bacterium MarineAlpha6_Bin5]|tara:strand:+ start:27 stop:1385 length:1359 start_codon:yes stop_codon:yes gene_type:complete